MSTENRPGAPTDAEINAAISRRAAATSIVERLTAAGRSASHIDEVGQRVTRLAGSADPNG